jgi:thiamine biosynthesis lipoprotein
MARGEHIERFACFGSFCSVSVVGDSRRRSAREAARAARRSLEGWHRAFSRFLPDSELSRLNADPRREVPVSPLLARLVIAVGIAGRLSHGLVDATLVGELETAGYEHDLGEPLALAEALALAPPRKPAGASAAAGWRALSVDLRAGVVTRPPGLRIDSGGLAKGLFADVLASCLGEHRSFAVDCAGDLALGARAGSSSVRATRDVYVESPLDASILHTFELGAGGVATSGIAKRSWLDGSGRAAHHLLDPATGRPAFTGVLQATALAPSALEAEVRAKYALLAGPRAAAAKLVHGGVLVYDDGSHEIVAPPHRVTLGQLAPFAPDRVGAPAPAPAGHGQSRQAPAWRGLALEPAPGAGLS